MARMPMTRGAALTAFLDHYNACDTCGVLPRDVDLPAKGDLCPKAMSHWTDLSALDQVNLVGLGLVHLIEGVSLDGDAADEVLRLVPPGDN